jgi:hypothetical protein
MNQSNKQVLSITEGTNTSKQPIALGADGEIKMTSVDELMRLCRWIINSKMAPKGIDSPEAALMIIQHGAEVGLKPMQSLRGIAFINGRPSLFGDAALAVCRAHPAFENIEETMDEERQLARCMIKRKGNTECVRTFSVEDAKRANLWGKTTPWNLYPRRMLQMRARGLAMRDSFPDALNGLSIAEESMDIQPTPKRNERPVARGIVLPDEETKDVIDCEIADISTTTTTDSGSSEALGEEFKW